MIKITKHQEIVDDVAGEVKLVFTNRSCQEGVWYDKELLTLTLPEARELLKALNEKIK